MRSKTSFFNKELFKSNITRFWPLWVLVSLGGCVIPLVEFLTRNESYPRNLLAETESAYYGLAAYAVPGIAFAYAILVAMLVWGYLYKASGVGMMHSLPVTRQSMFFTGYMSGLVMVVVPFLIVGIFVILVQTGIGTFAIRGILTVIVAVVCECILFFSIATLSAMLVGNLAALPILYLFLNFLFVVAELMLQLYMHGFQTGVPTDYQGRTEFMSPLVYLYSNVCATTEYEWSLGGNQYISGAKFSGMGTILIYGLAGIVIAVVSGILYKIRRSETAGDVISFKPLKPVLLEVIAIASGVIGGYVLYLTFHNSTEDFTLIPLALCMLAFGAVGYIVMQMIMNKTARVFDKKRFTGLAITLAVLFVLCAGVALDIFGNEKKVPDLEDIETVNIETNTYSTRYVSFSADDEAETVAAITGIHKNVAEFYSSGNEPDYIYNVTAFEENDCFYMTFNITYKLKNGRTLKREYSIPVSSKRRSTAGTFENDLEKLYAMDDFVSENYSLLLGSRLPEDISIYYNNNEENIYLDDTADIRTLISAIQEDYREGNFYCSPYYYFGDYDSYVMDFEYLEESADGSGYYSYYDSIYNFVVSSKMSNTLAAIETFKASKGE